MLICLHIVWNSRTLITNRKWSYAIGGTPKLCFVWSRPLATLQQILKKFDNPFKNPRSASVAKKIVEFIEINNLLPDSMGGIRKVTLQPLY